MVKLSGKLSFIKESAVARGRSGGFAARAWIVNTTENH
jgi:hypothetical protein